MLVVPRERAGGFTGRGDFFLEADGRLWRDRAAPAMPYVYASMQIVHPRLFSNAPEGPFSLNLLWDKAIAAGRLFGLVHDGGWFTVDTPGQPRRRARAGSTAMAGSVFTVPAGASFVDAIAAGLIARHGAAPEALAEVLVLVPTRRAVRSLREAFLRQSQGRPLILPAMRPLGDVDEDDLALSMIAEAESGADLAPAIAPLRRRLLLARRIRGAAGAGGFGPVGDEQATQLADALAGFLDEVDTAEADMAALDGLVEDETLSEHWQTTLAFLRAVTADWPQALEHMGVLDPAQRRRLLMDRLTEHWSATPPQTPVIAAGSTGTIPATARLLSRVARLPQGAVVLPGLDLDMTEEAWGQVEASHPQHALKGLLERLDVTRGEVSPWPLAADADLPRGSAARRRLLSDALLPAEATASWPDLPVPPPEAIAGLDIAACANPRVEAQVAALRMRVELAEPGRTVALVTRDRELARRVAAELRRWDIAVDDSAGEALTLTRGGAFLRLIAAAVADRLAPVALLALLKHPLTRLGAEPGTTRATVRRLELAILRGPRPAPGIDGLHAALEGNRQDTPELRRLVADARRGARAPCWNWRRPSRRRSRRSPRPMSPPHSP